jgi:hypothetical protein
MSFKMDGRGPNRGVHHHSSSLLSKNTFGFSSVATACSKAEKSMVMPLFPFNSFSCLQRFSGSALPFKASQQLVILEK